jgi:cell shape-determining protein MreC
MSHDKHRFKVQLMDKISAQEVHSAYSPEAYLQMRLEKFKERGWTPMKNKMKKFIKEITKLRAELKALQEENQRLKSSAKSIRIVEVERVK